jgi:hypothetical protein
VIKSSRFRSMSAARKIGSGKHASIVSDQLKDIVVRNVSAGSTVARG